MSHSPAPWSVQEWAARDNDGAVESCGFQVVDANGYSVDSCTLEDESEANVSLIAAAPDLLAALQAATDCGMVPTTSAAEGGAAKFSRQVEVADMIRAAIAKALGEQNE